MSLIIVGKPEIETVDKKARLSVTLQGGSAASLFFEVDEKYRQYLCTEDSDAFLLILIEYAQLHGKNLQFEAPITDILLDYVNEYYIPLLADNISNYARIKVIAPMKPSVNERLGQAVGTGFSAGVDSFYTIYKQLETPINSLKLTHVLFANVGAQTYLYEKACDIFENKSKRLQDIIRKIDETIEFVEVNTNCLQLYSDVIGKGFTGPDARKTCSCVVALKKLFSTYYFSNTSALDKFDFSPKDPAYFDIFTVDMLNKAGVQFYLRGIETPKRIDKMKYIADRVHVQENLSVCVDKNCGVCKKCVRTQLELFVIKKLDDFYAVFDIKAFKRNMVSIVAKYLAVSEEHKLGFVHEIEEEAKKNGVHIPIRAYILSFFFYRPIYIAKRKIKKIIGRS